jgi:hypothetical protein
MIKLFSNLRDMTTLRGLILSGEGPRSDFEYLREGIITAVPEHADKICDSIDPAFVGAVGAAKWAKFQVDHADTFYKSRLNITSCRIRNLVDQRIEKLR